MLHFTLLRGRACVGIYLCAGNPYPSSWPFSALLVLKRGAAAVPITQLTFILGKPLF